MIFCSMDFIPIGPQRGSECGACHQRSDQRQIVGGVHTGRRGRATYQYGDAVAMPERAQLLQSLEKLDGRRFEQRKGFEKAGPVGIDAHVPVNRQAGRDRIKLLRERIARPWYGCSALHA